MKLIIAEKPNQAREYAKVLGGFTSHDGYMESKDYYLTWCFGHLIELENDTVYREGATWSKDYLPLIPTEFKYAVTKDEKKQEDKGKKKQLKIIKQLMSKSTSIINGTDADREGELIFLYVYNYLDCKLPYQRLWLSSLTDNTIREGFRSLKYKQGDKFITNLGKSGYARAITDWLVGVNATQAATLQIGMGNLLTIGRVQTAILKIICERYLKNKNFQKSYRYRIVAEHIHEGQHFQTTSDIFETKEQVEQLNNKLLSEHTFLEAKKEAKETKPPLLHTLDSLTIIANAKYGYSSQEVLESAQKLYELKMISYPRTEDPYINNESYEKLKQYLSHLATTYLNINTFSFASEKPQSVDTSKIKGSHDALIPTGETASYGKLTETQKIIYFLIVSRCLESFSTSAFTERITYFFDNNHLLFSCSGLKILDIGWRKYTYAKTTENENEEEESYLDLKLIPNEKCRVEKKSILQIESRPPAIYTDGTLIKDLANIGKYIEEENPELLSQLKKEIDLKNIQLGTKATRPSIMSRLNEVGFIETKSRKILPTEKGLKFYQAIKEMKVSNIAYTAILEKNLKDIFEGNKSENEYYTELNQYVRHIVKDIFSLKGVDLQLNEKRNYGLCPKCKKGKIVEGKKAYGCDQFKQGCDFKLWKTIAGKQLTEKNIKDLLDKGLTAKIKGFKSSKGKIFEAKIKLNDIFSTDFVFGD